MAKMFLSPEEEFANSPLGVSLKQRFRRANRGGPRQMTGWVVKDTGANKRTYDLLIVHLFTLLKARGHKPSLNVPVAVPRLTNIPLAPSRAWDWLLRSFESANKDLLASDEEMRLSLAFARGRLFSMYEDEQRSFTRLQMSKDTQERQRLYAAEKAANGGEIDFFNSNSWQRLRFEVLAESSGCCVLCGRSYREHGVAIEVDHIKPRSRFPNLSLDKDNLQVMCFDCNRGKGNRDTTDWRASTENDNPEVEAA